MVFFNNFQICLNNMGMIQISVSDRDPHKEMPPGSGSAWTDTDPNPGGKKAKEMCRFIR